MKLFVFYSILVLVCFTIPKAHSQDAFKIIESRITTYLKEDVDVNQLNQDVKKNSSSIQQNGSWLEIDYSSKAETNWAPLIHLNRIKQFALSLAGAPDKQLAAHTITALRYWIQANPQSKNWFQNDIAAPTLIGELLLLLKSNNTLPSTLQDSLVNLMKQGDAVRAVGANKLDIAIHMMYRACITSDKILMDSAVHQAFMPISFNSKEGLQYDYSYLQHGPQLQIASYGQVFLTGEYKVASWLLGTTYALPLEKLKILDRYLIQTYLKTIRGRYIDFNTEGRGISRNDVLDKKTITTSAGKHSLLALAKEVNPNNALVLMEAEQRILQTKAPSFQIKPTHTYFYKGDYTLHNRPTYSFNVRTVSKRTIRTEYGNKENLIGKFLADGSTNIQRSGAEYFNIMPVWEWDKIPGTTSRDYAVDQKTTIEWGERGVGAFSGGTSDGEYGTTVYELNYDEVTAKKAWFFFADEVVCLGAAINSYAKETITTTINQAWQKGAVKAFANGKVVTADKGYSAAAIEWVWHDSVGYYFPNKGQISLTSNEQIGSWSRINSNRSKAEVKGKVFKLWFNHGVDPVNQTYAYSVKPGVGEDEMSKGSAIKIIANTAAMQAVAHTDLQMVQAVFYEAGSLTAEGSTITVDQPCVLLIKAIKSKNPIVTISDPTQKLTTIGVSLNGVPTSITLPQGDYKGATTSFQFN